MQKRDKPLTKAVLVGMQVIDAKGRLLGKVKDVVFEVGKSGISLSVENDGGQGQTVEWEDVQAASDFILLKPVGQSAYEAEDQEVTLKTEPYVAPVTATPKQKGSTQPLCPTCGKPLTWIPQYKRWYCYNDKKYV